MNSPSKGNEAIDYDFNLGEMRFYVILSLTLGMTSIITNIILAYIGLRFRLYKKSIFTTLLIANSIAGILVGMAVINNGYFDYSQENDVTEYYTITYCRMIMSPWVFANSFYQWSYLLQSLTLVFSIQLPLFYSVFLDTKRGKIVSLLFVFILTGLGGSLMFLPDAMSVDKDKINFCSSLQSWSMKYLLFQQGFTAAVTLLMLYNLIIMFRGAKSDFLNSVLGKSICYTMLYSKAIFIIFITLPNSALFITTFVGASQSIKNMLIDLMILGSSSASISTLFFYIFRNREIRKHFLELWCCRIVGFKNVSGSHSQVNSNLVNSFYKYFRKFIQAKFN